MSNEDDTNPQMQERVANRSDKEDEKQGKNVSFFRISDQHLDIRHLKAAFYVEI